MVKLSNFYYWIDVGNLMEESESKVEWVQNVGSCQQAKTTRVELANALDTKYLRS